MNPDTEKKIQDDIKYRQKATHGKERESDSAEKAVKKNWQKLDEILQDEAHQILWRNQSINSTGIEIQAKDGIITLNGKVDTQIMKELAESSVRELEGVEDVINHLEVHQII